jgi:2-phospho-L-lactate/phosphoenolpyruvate guanylyltransferase
MGWTAVVPLKGAAERKTRLASAFDAAQRRELSDQLYCHVVRSIAASRIADRIIAVSPALPDAGVAVRLWVQQESNLNAELERIRSATAGPLMVVNADLPLIQPEDLITLAKAASEKGCAICPDRHGTGTNAVALLPGVNFIFAFGPNSLALHLASAGANACQVDRPGLAYDLDTLADIDAILTFDALLPPDVSRLLRMTKDKGVRAALAAGD